MEKQSSILKTSSIGQGTFKYNQGQAQNQIMAAYSKEFIEKTKKLEQISLQLPFNPFDFKNVNSLKIRTKNTSNTHEKIKVIHMDGARIGREKSNPICFPDDQRISKHHAEIFFRDNNFYIKDIGSRTGTYYQVTQETVIQPNMLIQFGYNNRAELKVDQIEIKASNFHPTRANNRPSTPRRSEVLPCPRPCFHPACCGP